MLFDRDQKAAEINNKWRRSNIGPHLHYSRLLQCRCFGGVICLAVMLYTVQRLRQQFPLKCRHAPKTTHGITSQKTVKFSVINYRKFKVSHTIYLIDYGIRNHLNWSQYQIPVQIQLLFNFNQGSLIIITIIVLIITPLLSPYFYKPFIDIHTCLPALKCLDIISNFSSQLRFYLLNYKQIIYTKFVIVIMINFTQNFTFPISVAHSLLS